VERALDMIPFVDARTNPIHTALMKSAESGVTEAVDILLKAGIKSQVYSAYRLDGTAAARA
jgi:hypothetical protein